MGELKKPSAFVERLMREATESTGTVSALPKRGQAIMSGAEYPPEALRVAYDRGKAEGLPPPEQLAQKFHEAYERLAPEYGYKTRDASAVPWEQVPEANRRLMIAVCEEIVNGTSRESEAEPQGDRPAPAGARTPAAGGR